jgi:hypothetical protein
LYSTSTAFYLKPNTDGLKHHEAFYLSQHGSEPDPAYDLRHLDPASPHARNVYAAAIYDSHSPEILYAETLVKPGWTQPSLSQDDIRKNGGIPPPPQPLLPTGFTLQLYNPEQQVEVTQKTSTWTGNNWYEFSMPQESFRYPSVSALDKGRNDPAADPTVTKINFMWKRESKLSKDMTCFLTGKSTDTSTKKKGGKEPDIAIALFKGLKEITMYESNMYRVEMEDYKGLEVVILLSAAVIRDVFFGNMKDTFHVLDPMRKNSGGIQTAGRPAAVNGLYNSAGPSGNYPQNQSLAAVPAGGPRPPPPPDPRAQWEIDAETARLRAESDAQRRDMEARRRQQQKTDEEEQRRIRKMLEIEDKERRRKQAEIDKETERLRKLYGTKGQDLRPTTLQPQRHSAPAVQGPYMMPQQARPANGFLPVPQAYPPQMPPRPIQNGPYMQPFRPAASQSTFFGGGGQLRPDTGQTLNRPKKSFWGLRNASENNTSKLAKKKSSIF